MNDLAQKLQSPFRPQDIEWRVGATNKEKTKGMALAYVTNRAIQNRLDEVFGPFGWRNEFREWKGNSQLCGISVWDEQKSVWITKWDGADDSDMESVKGGLSDAMKRAAYQWGIGRYLYNLPTLWCNLKQLGSTHVLDGEPTLPAWALPANTPQPAQHTPTQPAPKPQTQAPAQQPAAHPQTTSTATASEAQLKLVHSLCKRHGLDPMQIANESFAVQTLEELTKQQASAMIDKLSKMSAN